MSDQLRVSDADAARLLASLPVSQPARARRSTEGSEHIVWFVNDDMVLRVPVVHDGDDDDDDDGLEALRREKALLDVLRAEAEAAHAPPQVRDAIPEILALGTSITTTATHQGSGGQRRWAYALCRRAAGVSVEEAPPGAVTAETERGLAALLAVLGRRPVRDAAERLGYPPADERRDRELTGTAAQAWRRLRDRNQLGALAGVDFEGYLAAADADMEPPAGMSLSGDTEGVEEEEEEEEVLSHADLKGEHIFIDAATGRLGGVIDWSDARAAAHPGTDVGGLAISLGAAAAARVGAGAGRNPAAVRRGLRVARCEAVERLDAVLNAGDDSPEGLVRRQLARALEGVGPLELDAAGVGRLGGGV
ncbi:hypothetical protein JDV02_003923 [Purpureocillium takamizusanense]|uniref:Aminoglycoside phosphotransferase domain-containing protein n=1 Tax=Purpureocillium takamizusanense TaxID=2060973 RepID=A0A9Q8QE84_9HYPO|nr:uncharacterized protein JDV02_003923 [Purpureocillium takamizusanense]UNI17591.1 hypothetical protein JDV02_003923 [Purpureocillium takamizusanense]